jgi:hypothetical protein
VSDKEPIWETDSPWGWLPIEKISSGGKYSTSLIRWLEGPLEGREARIETKRIRKRKGL